MEENHSIRLFENKKVRVRWVEKEEKWYFSIVDVILVLAESPNPRKYWSVLKTRLKAEGSQLATDCSQLKLQSSDGKYYLTDVGDTEHVLRLVQSKQMRDLGLISSKEWLTVEREDAILTAEISKATFGIIPIAI